MKVHQVAIIGTGNIAIEHLNGYRENGERCKVKYLCDIFEDKAKVFAKENNLEDVIITTDYKTLLEEEDLDIVSICLPPSFHKEIVCAFLKKGKNVLCEKPMASSLEEGREMIDAMNESGKILSIVSQNRFKTPIMRVKKMLDDGIFGKIVMTRVNSMWYRGSNYYNLWWRGTWEKEGGGCTLNHSVHQIDMMGWLLGDPINIYSTIKNYLHTNSEVEDTSLSIVDFGTSIAQLGVSLNDHDEKQEFYIQCEKASISIPFSVKCMKQLENGFPERDEESEKYFTDYYNSLDEIEKVGHSGQIENLLDAIENKDKLLVSAKDGYKAMEIIMAVYKSSLSRKIVDLPILDDDSFYSKKTMIEKMPKFFEKKKSVENLSGTISLGSQENK